MSSYKNHWTSENKETRINKLEESLIYNIVDVQKIETSFGKKYIIIDEEDNRYWPNKKLEEFIKSHKDVKKFQLTTSELKDFKNKKGDVINFLEISIDY